MDFESLLPIVIGIIYLINRVLKERKKQKQQRPAPPTGQRQTSQATPQKEAVPKKKPFTFDDILKEFEKNLAGEELVEEYEKPLPVEEIRHEKPRVVEVKQEKKPNIYQTYEGTSYETPEVLAEDRAEKEGFSRNENYAVKGQEEENEFIKLLREPGGPKNAIVLSEILNRKHFQI